MAHSEQVLKYCTGTAASYWRLSFRRSNCSCLCFRKEEEVPSLQKDSEMRVSSGEKHLSATLHEASQPWGEMTLNAYLIFSASPQADLRQLPRRCAGC